MQLNSRVFFKFSRNLLVVWIAPNAGVRCLLLLTRRGWLPFLAEHGRLQGAPEAIEVGFLGAENYDHWNIFS